MTDDLTPELEERLREIVRDEEQKTIIRENQIAEQLELTNAILAVIAMNHETQFRRERNNEPPTNYSYTWRRFATDVSDALHTFEEDLDR